MKDLRKFWNITKRTNEVLSEIDIDTLETDLNIQLNMYISAVKSPIFIMDIYSQWPVPYILFKLLSILNIFI